MELINGDYIWMFDVKDFVECMVFYFVVVGLFDELIYE